jgi:mannose-6-phosphate isomerase-like protein (cupin superfamily)
VTFGTPFLTVGTEIWLAREGETVIIPAGTVHRIANNSDLNKVEIIEVQRGMCREDDIVRLEDDYGRV